MLDLGVAKSVKPQCRGEALLWRYAEDWVCALRYRSEAEWFSNALPERLARFSFEEAREKTRILRFSRFHPSMKRRLTFRGCAFFWKADRQGVARVRRRTARKKLQGACRRIKEWITQNRPLPGRECFQRVNARLRGHYNYDGLRGNSGSLSRFFNGAMDGTFKWLNRRGGKRKRCTWEQFTQILDRVKRARPRMTEVKRRRVLA